MARVPRTERHSFPRSRTVLRDDNAFSPVEEQEQQQSSGYPEQFAGVHVITRGSQAARKFSRRHWSRVAGNASTPEAIAEAAASLSHQLRTGLSPWIGADGYAALHTRALREVRAAHPVLGELSLSDDDGKATELAVREHGAAAVSGGIIAFVATLIELLGKIIGVEMALRLVEHWGDRARAES